MKSTIEVLLCFALFTPASAQGDVTAAIEKIYAAYNTDHIISFSGSLKMYAKNNPGKIIEQMTSSYTLKGTNFTCRIGPIEMLVNNKYYVSVDKTIKLIMIGYKKDLSGTEQAPVLNTGQFKKWIEAKTIDAAIMTRGTNAVLQLTDKRGITGYHLYSIVYDTLTGFMKKAFLETSDYNDRSHKTVVLEISYTSPVTTVKNHDVFSERQFFSVVNNKLRIAHNYQAYQLINQL